MGYFSRQPAGARCPLLGPWRILQFARERLPGRFRPPVGRIHVALAQFEGFLALRLLAGVVPASHISSHPQFCIAELVSPLRVGPVPRRRRDRSLRRSEQIRKMLPDFYPPYLDAMARERARYPINVRPAVVRNPMRVRVERVAIGNQITTMSFSPVMPVHNAVLNAIPLQRVSQGPCRFSSWYPERSLNCGWQFGERYPSSHCARPHVGDVLRNGRYTARTRRHPALKV